MTAHNCEATRISFSDYLEGALSDPDRQRIDDEISGCPACQAEIAKLRDTVGRLHGLRESAPPSFLFDIKSQIHRRSRGRFFARRWLLFGRIPFEWVSFVMILVMLLYYIVQLQGSPTDVAPAP